MIHSAIAEDDQPDRSLDLPPDAVQELDEAAWYARAFRGDRPQLTPRAAATGMALGLLLATTNLYFGLKTGWTLGMGLTACVLSYSLFGLLGRLGLARTPLSLLESGAMASTASAASFSTGNTLLSAVPALLLLSVTSSRPGGTPLPWPITAAWVFLLAVLGTCLAIPMKRSLINQERLRFPSGTAVANLLHSLHGKGSGARGQARRLLLAALAAGVVPLLRDLAIRRRASADATIVRDGILPAAPAVFDGLPGIAAGGVVHPLSAWNLRLDYSPGLLAAGALMGLRVALSLALGASLLILVIGPMALGAAATDAAGRTVMAATSPGTVGREIGVWIGAPLLVGSAVLASALEWRAVVRAMRGLRRGAFLPGGVAGAVEVPPSWFAIGAGLSGAGVVLLAWRVFGVPIPYGILSIVATFALSVVVCRVSGETDIAPYAAMGKIMQLAYGTLVPQNATANLMTAGVTVGASAASADLLTDLKTGHLLGASPRRQFLAQLLGVLPGTVATVFCYSVLVPDATALTDAPGRPAAFAVPAARAWLAVARVFKEGIASLHPMAQRGIAGGLAAGLLLTFAERALPKYRRFLPSPTGLGLGLFLPPSQSLTICAGAAVAAIAGRFWNGAAAERVVPVASGLIAGEALVGVVVAVVNALL